MTDEEIEQKFKETYPDFVYGDTPLSPYFDIWCYAIEIMEQENEQLNKQIEKMKMCKICKHYRWNCCSYEIRFSKDCIENGMKLFELKE